MQKTITKWLKSNKPIIVGVLSFVTLGIYYIFWLLSKARLLRFRGYTLQPTWLLFIPIANAVWFYSFAQAAEVESSHRVKTTPAYVLLSLIPTFFVGAWYVESRLSVIDVPKGAPDATKPDESWQSGMSTVDEDKPPVGTTDPDHPVSAS